MKRLANAIIEKKNAEIALAEAKAELTSAIIETIEEEGNMFASDISAIAGLPTCAVIGAITTATNSGWIEANKRTCEKVYVRLNKDGSINKNDTLIRKYNANEYSLARRR